MELAKLLTTKIKESELSASAAAEKAGVAYPPFASVAAGKSLPNARTFKKYAKFLGISAGDVQKMVEAEKASKPAGRRARRGPGRPPGKRGPGRPPGTGRGHRRSGGGIAASLQDAVRVVAEAEQVLADQLAVTVHRLGKRERQLVESIVAGLR